MQELRSELETYASAGEPPMSLAFDDVVTVAKRKHHRRRSTVIASGVAVVAAVGIAVPTFLMAPNSPPGVGIGVAATGTCRAEQRTSERIACVVREKAPPELGSLKLESVTSVIPQSSSSDGGTIWQVTDGQEVVGSLGVTVDKLGATEPDHGKAEFPSYFRDTSVTFENRGYQIRVWSYRYNRVTGPTSELLLSKEAMTRIATTPELLP
ncbi:hypothetical protein [Kibdelosporangium phytohabitans]|uniref:Uncharacterized protein n=1 Tax=Kibdelosporangium phytohabitans TaxID=860235 RepID=A0A0N7F4C8_9PSEU|nr:hypothetical protein [Kibdelosporangium phytohabitans]ALG11071.1 hypothetical protein AOZ06_33050 [Kibdelosporangium phytohabitans]MBE1462309.1 hypothetical protein [Kibdelosporangium phytohabitans]